MMSIADAGRYEQYRKAQAAVSRPRRILYDLGLPVLLFGSVGAVAWAIRGTNGWGGIDGTIVPGMTWGLLWYYLCSRRGIDARSIPLWLGLGIAIGGELGYGQYISWIQGRFEAPSGPMPIAPWVGYAWLAIAGIGWGAPGGIALGWALSGHTSARRWLGRLFVPAGTACLGWLLVQACPRLFFPHYDLGLYSGELDRHLTRTVETNTQNLVVVAWWVGALLTAALHRDRTTLSTGVLIGAGFGAGFSASAVWCLGYTYAPGFIDWWKMWELGSGFGLGLLYAAALYWATRQFEAQHAHDTAMPARISPPAVRERLRDVSLVLSVFILLFVLFFGASSRTGVVLGLYDSHDVDQYEWPPARVALFAPVAVLLSVATVHRLWGVARGACPQEEGRPVFASLPERMADLIALIGVVAAVTIWPEKIGALYAFFVAVALFAYNRLNRHYAAARQTPRLPRSSVDGNKARR